MVESPRKCAVCCTSKASKDKKKKCKKICKFLFKIKQEHTDRD
jgi:hypothetical protein